MNFLRRWAPAIVIPHRCTPPQWDAFGLRYGTGARWACPECYRIWEYRLMPGTSRPRWDVPRRLGPLGDAVSGVPEP